jgi:hypothetical protein
MGKIILEFDSTVEADEAKIALQAGDWKMAVWDIDQYLRGITKHSSLDGREATELEIEFADKIREELRDILNVWNLKLD